MMQTAEATLGKMEGQMVSLDSIATHPEKQGRGYGTALGKIVTDIVSCSWTSFGGTLNK